MKTLFLRVLLVMGSLVAMSANAGVIGSFDASRTYASYYLGGGSYDDIRNAITGAGHTVAGSTGTVTAGYLGGLDVFYTGMVDVDSNPGAMASAAEITALQSWVAGGGVLVIGGENSSFDANANSFLNPFGLNLVATAVSGGTWAAGPDPLLAGGVAGSSLGFASGGYFTAGAYDTLATVGGNAAIVRASYGAGTVIGLGDGNFIDDPASQQSRQFFVNIMNANAVPVPASVWLLMIGAGLMGLARRR